MAAEVALAVLQERMLEFGQGSLQMGQHCLHCNSRLAVCHGACKLSASEVRLSAIEETSMHCTKTAMSTSCQRYSRWLFGALDVSCALSNI